MVFAQKAGDKLTVPTNDKEAAMLKCELRPCMSFP